MTTPKPASGVSVSVIVGSYRSWSTLPLALAGLRAETVGSHREVVLVESSGEFTGDELGARWPWLRVVTPPERANPGRARNIGVAAAKGDKIAFLDADAIPEPGWLDALEAALTPDLDAVVGAVVNGTPTSATGTAGYLLEFSDWLPGRRGVPLHGVTCNLLIRRDALERAGGLHEDLEGGEDTILTLPLGRGGRLGFAKGARVRHLNRTGWRAFLARQYELGTFFPTIAERVDFPNSRLARPALVPLTPVLRLFSLGGRLAAHPREAAVAIVLLPVLLAGTTSWAAGLARGYRRDRGEFG
jgi:glycosyltransferase involved in cell wall biosynthesis